MNHFGHENIPMIVYGSLPSFIGFFSLGCYAGQCGYDISLPKILLLIFIMLGWSVAETYWFHDYGNPSRALGFKLSVQSYSFCAYCISFVKKYNKTQLYIARRILASPNWLSFIHDIFDSHASLAHSEYLRTYYKFLVS